MSRSVTREDLRTRIRQACDIENDEHVTDDELNSLINTHYPWYWDLLIEMSPPDLVSKSFQVTTVAGTRIYDLESSSIVADQDFYKLKAIFRLLADGTRVPIRHYTDTDQWAWQPINQSGLTFLGFYYPSCPVLDDDADTIEGYSGWEEILVQKIAMEVMKKRQENYQPFLDGFQRMEARIRKMATPDHWEPQRVVRRKWSRWMDWWYQYDNVSAYMLRGGKLELVSLKAYPGAY